MSTTATDAPAHSHPYHLVRPSPWPIISAVAAFVTAIGAIQYFHQKTLWILALGLGLVLVSMFGWWRDVIREGEIEKAHTPVVRHGLRMGVVLFIISEVMFFSAFFWAYFHFGFGFFPGIETWPPPGITPLNAWDIPFLNTLILLSSGLSMNWAHHALRANHRTETARALGLTVLLGVIFLILQGVEYGHAAFALADGVFPSVFYLATGFHGFHVFVGVCFLAVNLLRLLSGQFQPQHHIGFEAAAWYWHFVDVVWLFLFVWVYWWAGA